MHHEDGQVREELQQVVSVRDAVHGIAGRAVKAQLRRHIGPVQGIGGPGQGSCPQRALVHAGAAVADPCVVSSEHLKVGAQVVGQGRRLGLLQVGEARHIGLCVGLHDGQDGLQELLEQGQDLIRRLPCIEAHIQGDLVVAAAACVQALSGIADPVDQVCLHEAVDVLIVRSNLQLSTLDIGQDPLQALPDRLAVLRRQDPLLSQHGRMDHAAGDVLPVQAFVKADGVIEGLDGRIGLFGESSAP